MVSLEEIHFFLSIAGLTYSLWILARRVAGSLEANMRAANPGEATLKDLFRSQALQARTRIYQRCSRHRDVNQCR